MYSTQNRCVVADQPEARSDSVPGCLIGPGEACALARATDWKQTSLGPVAGWSQALRSTAALVLHNHSPMLLWWGDEFVQMYNDAYRPVLGDKHPRAMGQKFSDCWSEVFHILGPMAERPFRGGLASVSDDVTVLIERKLPREETHFRLAYSPVPDESVDSGIGGVLATVTEISEQIFSDRQIGTLRELGSLSSADMKTAQQVCVNAAAVLGKNPWDVPFALFFAIDENGERAEHIASSGADPHLLEGSGRAGIRLKEAQTDDQWCLLDVITNRHIRIVDDIAPSGESPLRSPWGEEIRSAIVLPLASPDQVRPFGVLICGLSPHRVLDAGYRTFFELMASQLVTAIRDARALEEERKRAESLAAIDHAKTVFFSNVSHEFRTPLTLMLGPMEAVLADPSTPDPVRAQLDLAHRNALRLLKLVNTLLDFSQIEAGRARATYEPTDLAELTRDLASTFRSAIESGGLIFSVDCAALPEPVYVDRQMWEKVVFNLLSNAFKYTLRGEITVRLWGQGEQAVLEVADTGAGIPEQELPRIFERFHRVDNAVSRTQEGTGIGLSMVHELINLHGGEIATVSEIGKGTTFRIVLPFGFAHLPADQIEEIRTSDTASLNAQPFVQEALRWTSLGVVDASPPSRAFDAVSTAQWPPSDAVDRTRVLLVDDNADMRAYLHTLLARRYEVEVAENGAAALEAAARRKPDLILSDIMMPQLDGIGLLQMIRNDRKFFDVPVILLSARAGEEARVSGLDAGADDYLVKPFSARELLARIDSLLELTALRRQGEQRFRALVSASSDAVYAMNADWSEMRFLHGKNFLEDTENVSADWLERYIAPEDQPAVLARIGEAIGSKNSFELEHRVKRVDGSTGWTLSRAIPVLDNRGEIAEWFGMAIDMTGHKRAEAALRESAAWADAQKEAFRSALNDAPLSVSLDTLAQAAVEQIEGHASCAFYIANLEGTELQHVAGMPGFQRLRIAADSSGGGLAAFSAQPVITANVTEEPRWKEWLSLAHRHGFRGCWSFPIETSTRKVVGTFAIYHEQPREPTARDYQTCMRLAQSAAIIISRYQEGQERARHAVALRQADRQKDEFLAMLAHELRNPLAAIANAGELMFRLLAVHAEAQSPIAMIKRQTDQLSRLVDDLLDVSRITNGRITLQRRPLDIAAVVAQGVETVEPRLRERRHRLTVEMTTGDEPLYVNGDMARLVQCVVNLLSNAVKYTDPGGAIRVRTRPDKDKVVIGISDDGSGIPSALLPRVFDLFVQSERTLDRAQGGLGIGLAVVRSLVTMHDGTVTAHSQGIGRGSTFEITLPRIARPGQATTPHADPAKPVARRVLVVDDNADAADSLSTLLTLEGHTLEVAYNGDDAIRLARIFRPEVALLDIGLPGMSGYELAQRLRAIRVLAGLRLIAITGYGQSDDHQRSRAAGFDDHLVKPVDYAALSRVLAATNHKDVGADES